MELQAQAEQEGGPELAREAFLSRWGQAGGRIMELVQEGALGRAGSTWRRWPSQAPSPAPWGALGTGASAGIWFGLGPALRNRSNQIQLEIPGQSRQLR